MDNLRGLYIHLLDALEGAVDEVALEVFLDNLAFLKFDLRLEF